MSFSDRKLVRYMSSGPWLVKLASLSATIYEGNSKLNTNAMLVPVACRVPPLVEELQLGQLHGVRRN